MFSALLHGWICSRREGVRKGGGGGRVAGRT